MAQLYFISMRRRGAVPGFFVSSAGEAVFVEQAREAGVGQVIEALAARFALAVDGEHLFVRSQRGEGVGDGGQDHR